MKLLHLNSNVSLEQPLGNQAKKLISLNYYQTIVRVVEASSAADDRHRCEHLLSVKTLDDLHSEITRLGFNLNRFATYLR